MKEILYKLTDKDGNTQNNTHWAVGVTNKVKRCKDPKLCSADVLHAYRNINLAYLLNPSHANITNPVLWKCEGTAVVSDWGKVGCFSLSVIKKMRAPKWVNSDKEKLVRVAFAVLCAESMLKYYEDKYPDDDRPRKAIEAAKRYLDDPSAPSYAASAYAYAAAAYAYAAYAKEEIEFCALADKAVKMVMKAK